MNSNIGVKALSPGETHPCPFCGGSSQMLAAIPVDGLVRFAVGCECGAVGPSTETTDALSQEEINARNTEAVELWNKRAKP